jgi:hypothetical protein
MSKINKENRKKTNIEDILLDLLEATSEELLVRIESGEASPQDISNAIRLCKENGIDISIKKGEPLDIISKKLPFEGENVVKMNNG